MSPSISEDDVGKTVENADGTAIGTVVTVERNTAYVETEPGLTDSIRATLGWESDSDDAVPIDEGDVGEITENAIRLAVDRSSADDDSTGHDPVIERDEGADHRDLGGTSAEMGGTEAAGRDEAEGDSGEGRPPDGDRTVTEERGENEDR